MAAKARVNGSTIAMSIPASAQQLEPAFQRHDQQRRPVGREQAGRVGGERQHRGLTAAPRGARARLGQQRGVSEVDAVEVADRERERRRAAGRPAARRGEAGRAGHDLHGRGRRDHAVDSGDQRLELERLFDDSLVRDAQRRAPARRHAGHQRERRAGEERRELRRQLRRARRARDHEIAEHGRGRVPLAAASRAPRATSRTSAGAKPGLAEDLDHQASDVRRRLR